MTAEDVSRTKPHPDIFLRAAQKLGLDPAECVVVEDAPNGILAAKAAGMRCLAVAQTFAEDKLTGADVVRPAMAEVSLGELLGEPPR